MRVLGVELPPAAAEREPVLDVPAIDMTEQSDTAAPDAGSGAVAKPVRRRAVKPKARRATTVRKSATPKQTRDGSVGRETFAAVEALVQEGSSKTDAFKTVGASTKRSAGTVAATYYRVARSEGAVKQPRGRGKATTTTHSATTRSAGRRGARSSPGTAPGGRSGRQASDIDRLTDDLVQSVNELAAAMKSQTQQVADLRRRLDGVRSLLD
jgi:hypothetical protein